MCNTRERFVEEEEEHTHGNAITESPLLSPLSLPSNRALEEKTLIANLDHLLHHHKGFRKHTKLHHQGILMSPMEVESLPHHQHQQGFLMVPMEVENLCHDQHR
ncbi:uncharacterized protein DS421_14g467870 [Arachis hypogaea]|nr:uncharacterized protein DS421_14g467870 [Arachis hypogaea]